MTATGQRSRRDALLDAAQELFLAKPYDQVTTSEIVERAGVAYGLLAHHFGNKRGLYIATLHAAADTLRSRRDSPPTGRTPAEQLRNTIAGHVAYIRENAAGYLALVHGSLGADPDARAVIDDLQASGAQLVLDRLGAPSPAPPVLRAALAGWVSFVNGLLEDYLTHLDLPEEQVVDLAADALLTALTRASLAASVSFTALPLDELLNTPLDERRA